ncbi:MAG: hypothetical protein EVA65_03490 [Oceanococcus sp.]|nr:MAG: hypothetical protein EVA65_03490 [Oceanococcus sp.]
MDKFHLYFDEQGQVVVVEDHPLARQRYGRKPAEGQQALDALSADRALHRYGGFMVPAEGDVVWVPRQTLRA